MSTSTSKSCPSLPLELWIIIFSYATAPVTVLPQRPRLFPRELELLLQRRLIKVTHTLTLVCKLWRAVELPLLYRTVYIKTPDMARHFLRTLVESASSDPQAGHAQWVRHLVLPELRTKDSWQDVHIINILQRCPHLETLWKPYYSEHHDRSFWRGFGSPTWPPHALSSLTKLRHVYWVFCSSTDIDIAARRLSEFLSHAPHLVSLSIKSSGEPGAYYIRPNSPLTSLTTLEYRGFGTLNILHRDMPNLTRLIARPETIYRGNRVSLLSRFGQQLTAIEFIDSQSSSTCRPHPSPLAWILSDLPNLNALTYNLSCVLGANAAVSSSIENVVLRVTSRPPDDEALEQCLLQHFDVLTGPAFPALRRVVLDGIDEPFRPGYAVMHRRFPVQRVDGTSVIWER